MKKLILLSLSLFFFLNPYAQDDTYAGPAKIYVKSFWSQVQKLKEGKGTTSSVTNLERAMASVKEKDAAYNTAAMEAETKKWKDEQTAKQNAANAASNQADEERTYFKNVWSRLVDVHSWGIEISGIVTGTAFYDKIKAVNLEEFKQRKSALNGRKSSYADDADKILADYEDFVKRSDMVKWVIDDMISHAKSAKIPAERTKLFTEARMQCMGLLLILPDHALVKQKLGDINKLSGEAEAATAKFITSDFHKEHLNQIVWSTKPLVIGQEKGMSSFIKTEFKSGETIFGTAYLARSLKDAQGGQEKLHVIIKVDNGTAVWGGDLSYFIVPASTQDKSYVQFALIPDEAWMKDHYASYIAQENWTLSYLMDNLSQAGDVHHDITCDLDFAGFGAERIESKLAFDMSGGSAALKKMASDMHQTLMATRKLPKAGMSNPAIEQQMLTVMNKLGWEQQFKKVVITSSEWTVVKNDLTGAILYRFLGAVGAGPDPDGKCYYQEFTFKQDYTGAGKFESTIRFNSYGGKRELGCDKIK